MVINKKWQPCSGIIQNNHIQKQKIKTRFGTDAYTHTRAHTHTHTNMNSVYLVSEGGCAVIFNNTC